jgi:hypothetical protein
VTQAGECSVAGGGNPLTVEAEGDCLYFVFPEPVFT